MKLISLLLALGALAGHAEPDNAATPQVQTQSTRLSEREDISRFIDELVTQEGFDRTALAGQFDQVQLKPHILDILDRPSTSRPYYEFRPNFVNASRIRAGVAWWQGHAALLEAVSQKYGVEPEYLLAIIGVETMWGKNTGSFRVMDALTTISFGYPRRAEFFRKELREFLLMARTEHADPLSFHGSYAGAMGMPQFMPSSFRAYAQDWDGDGQHDIWNNPGDILASVANYFAQHGWMQGAPLVAPAVVDPDRIAPLVEDKFNLHYKLSELADYGVSAATAQSGDPLAVLVPLETSAGTTRYWLGLGNFYVITRYNRSTLYAMAVHELAQAMKAAYLDPSRLPAEPAKVKKKRKKR
ncbi:lytic murein transglycosylase B [Chitinimonas sp.]|uniref:lytic murein transglycosylase B n=1 Tax=Chitinimonas sp. TaxID=1934313 RepID=UPI0035ADDCBF